MQYADKDFFLVFLKVFHFYKYDIIYDLSIDKIYDINT